MKNSNASDNIQPASEISKLFLAENFNLLAQVNSQHNQFVKESNCKVMSYAKAKQRKVKNGR